MVAVRALVFGDREDLAIERSSRNTVSGGWVLEVLSRTFGALIGGWAVAFAVLDSVSVAFVRAALVPESLVAVQASVLSDVVLTTVLLQVTVTSFGLEVISGGTFQAVIGVVFDVDAGEIVLRHTGSLVEGRVEALMAGGALELDGVLVGVVGVGDDQGAQVAFTVGNVGQTLQVIIGELETWKAELALVGGETGLETVLDVQGLDSECTGARGLEVRLLITKGALVQLVVELQTTVDVLQTEALLVLEVEAQFALGAGAGHSVSFAEGDGAHRVCLALLGAVHEEPILALLALVVTGVDLAVGHIALDAMVDRHLLVVGHVLGDLGVDHQRLQEVSGQRSSAGQVAGLEVARRATLALHRRVHQALTDLVDGLTFLAGGVVEIPLHAVSASAGIQVDLALVHLCGHRAAFPGQVQVELVLAFQT